MTTQQDRLPTLGLLALAVTLAIYIFSQIELCKPPIYFTGSILLSGGCIQLLLGIRSQQQGHAYAAAILLPLGIFWLSLFSYEIAPQLGVGRHPDPITMFSFMSLWGLFISILFLASFRQSVAIQTLYGAMMFFFLALAMNYLRDDRVFLFVGSGTGIFASLIAVYMVIAQTYNQMQGRVILPLGEWDDFAVEADDS
ncbi:MAG: acetate uptake transporter [Desulfuromusa sp.]|nr:acetate uptake transporter [Desulfuromusa sp.]